MKAKIRSSLTLKTLLPDIRAAFVNDKVKKAIREEVIDTINSGISPVNGNKFERYSEKYAKAKGVSRNKVDMLVTGRMLRSLQIRKTKSSFFLYFTSKIAGYHNTGGENLPERRLLPTKNGERFADKIQKLILRVAELAVKGSVNKQNRR